MKSIVSMLFLNINNGSIEICVCIWIIYEWENDFLLSTKQLQNSYKFKSITWILHIVWRACIRVMKARFNTHYSRLKFISVSILSPSWYVNCAWAKCVCNNAWRLDEKKSHYFRLTSCMHKPRSKNSQRRCKWILGVLLCKSEKLPWNCQEGVFREFLPYGSKGISVREIPRSRELNHDSNSRSFMP